MTPSGSDRRVLDSNDHAPCRFLDVMEVLGGKWRGTILYCLIAKPRRYNDLRRAIAPITSKVLTAELRALERDGLIERRSFDDDSTRMLYSLTGLGQSLFGVVEQLERWMPNLAEVERSRVSFDLEV